MITNETLPVIADPVLGGGAQSVVVSTVLIVMCVEPSVVLFIDLRSCHAMCASLPGVRARERTADEEKASAASAQVLRRKTDSSYLVRT